MVDLVNIIFSNPTYTLALTIVLGIIGILGRQYLGPEDDWIEQKKQNLARRLHPIAARLGRPLLQQKTIDEYVCSTTESPDFIETALHGCGYEENDVSNVKYRELPDGTRQYNVGQLSFSVADSNLQWHAYIFPGHGDYGADVYQHLEVDWDPTQGGDPEKHVTEPIQSKGDPERVLRDCLIEQDVAYEFDADWVTERQNN
jgi:hypothetical protein